MRNVLLAAALLLLRGGLASAENTVADSVEWMAVDAEVIVKVQVTGWKDTEGPGSVIYRDVAVKVDETLKGKKAAKTVTVRLRVFKGDRTGTEWKKADRAYLFFLREGRKGEEKGLVGKLLPRDGSASPAIDLRAPARAYGADLKRLTDAQVMLTRVKQFARLSPETARKKRITVGWGAEIHRELYGGSACYLIVPGGAK